jgi:hypothetical protein
MDTRHPGAFSRMNSTCAEHGLEPEAASRFVTFYLSPNRPSGSAENAV